MDMKRLSIVIVIALLSFFCLCLSACDGNGAASDNDKKVDVVDYDLTRMSPDEAFLIMGDLYSFTGDPASNGQAQDDYVGKTFRISGTIGRLTNAKDDVKYYQCRLNQTETTSAGKRAYGPYVWIEGKQLADANDEADEYPKSGSQVTVSGTFQLVDEYLYAEDMPLYALCVTPSNLTVSESK